MLRSTAEEALEDNRPYAFSSRFQDEKARKEYLTYQSPMNRPVVSPAGSMKSDTRHDYLDTSVVWIG